ncbi:hypothetical protein [Nocardiopsis salina]|uniref:hypothetical protein n=1 Tax=Nocardiopsis salina TaxID=245836 RepID=UPI00034DAE81|nr:hypothetical protein [Nocardiopsis salina]
MSENSPEPQNDGQPPKSERGGLWGLFFGAVGLLLPPYGIFLSAFGLVQGFRARRAARRRSVTAPMAMASVFVGSVGIVLSAAMAAVLFLYQDQVADYRDCTARAQTVSTQDACDQAWESGTGLPPEVIGG